ncbi:HPr family phosphocarrier protein [Aureimonas sp. Leaf324]|jgi:phosphocarrier protein|uniref:HPr family phosphocarrier protein n=1 Tax=Aureimonas sp. Leaf324 TaxID=1736336 RepID=UPI0006F2CB11|nr:HPr family phosphocarrier protein [Aureimonas sp. Leaf324]KQQ78919.1 serine kinase [Aureimonas sp. Leaf324]
MDKSEHFPPPCDSPLSGSSPTGPVEQTMTIVNRKGLHARASAKFVQLAEQFECDITITREGLSVGGQSIMGLMMLAAGQGTTIDVRAEGHDADKAVAAISALVADRFGEDC